MNRFSLLMLLLIGPMLVTQSVAQTERYKCPNCGRYHVRPASTNIYQPTNGGAVRQTMQPVVQASAVVVASSAGTVIPSTPSVQAASAAVVVPASASTAFMPAATPQRWRFHNATKWARRIDPNAQAWAQQEANRLAQRGYRGYLQNGHPGGNNPHASVTGTGTTFPGADLIHTCEGSNGMTLVAEAAAVSNDGRIYGVRSWR